ncbi:MAG: hypothetical protein Q8R81_05335 [Novosphingobium sp.]|uniref:hypothetical protein n=1 Tax=Novosphingobium sp. TaxID=1874826 RepID=UPI002733EA28|nr:hypothetical protein [Novosphingobium sp.]MDP3549800.1 hypothetical protein [Novosphingobium sp.]
MRLTALLAVPLFAGGLTGSTALSSKPVISQPAPASQCHVDEAVVYSCRFGRSLGSVCGTAHALHYRFGPAGKPALDLSSEPDWSNVRVGQVRGQGSGGYQEHVRFTNGNTHYIVYRGQNGELADNPGYTYSGISVQAGHDGERTLASLSCKGKMMAADSLADAAGVRAPADLDIAEAEGGAFDGWF